MPYYARWLKSSVTELACIQTLKSSITQFLTHFHSNLDGQATILDLSFTSKSDSCRTLALPSWLLWSRGSVYKHLFQLTHQRRTTTEYFPVMILLIGVRSAISFVTSLGMELLIILFKNLSLWSPSGRKPNRFFPPSMEIPIEYRFI